MLIDSHLHFIPKRIGSLSTFYKGIWQDKERLFSFLEENKIEKALLVYPFTDAYLNLKNGFEEEAEIYNKNIELFIKENEKIFAFGLVDWQKKDLDIYLKDLKNRGFKGICLPSSFEGKFFVKEIFNLFEAVQKYNFLIFVHPQTRNPVGFERVKDALLMPVLEYSFDISLFLGVLLMEGVLAKFKIKFIFASLAGVVPFLKDRFDRVYTMLRKRDLVKDLGNLPTSILKNVYVDTSGCNLLQIKMALDLFGEDRILWGSDYPVNLNVEDNLKMLENLGKEIKAKITNTNFLRLFDLDEDIS
jgi:predicted TIM-barrel fold metal-dependent hydrolase